MSLNEIHKTMARPIASFIPLLQKLAKEEYEIRVKQHLTPAERDRKVTTLLKNADKILDCLPVAVRRTVTVQRVSCADIINRPDDVQVDEDWQEVFDIPSSGNPNVSFVLQMGDLLQQGDYGFVYRAKWSASQVQKGDNTTAAAVKIAKIPSNNLWMLLEFVIHSILMSYRHLKPYFAHLLGAAVVHIDCWPYRELFLVQAFHPGVDMFDYMNDYAFNDRSLIAALQQIAFVVYHAQRTLRFMHRDLKVENVLIFDGESMKFPKDMPKTEQELFLRPPLLECEGVEFSTEDISIQLIDLGSSTLTTTSNTTICCTTNRHPETNNYNPAADMANFCLTLFHDHSDVIAIRAPMLHSLLQKIVQPMMDHMKLFPNESVDTVSHKCATPDFLPHKLIKTLQALRIGIIEREISSRANLDATCSVLLPSFAASQVPSSSLTEPV